MLSPGETQTKTFELKPMVQAIGVVVLYRDIDNAQWRADAPAAASGPTKLLLNVGKLAISLKPAPADAWRRPLGCVMIFTDWGDAAR